MSPATPFQLWRMALGLTQTQLARWLGVDKATIHRWEESGEPRLTRDQRRKVIHAGLNLAAIDGVGSIMAPGGSIDMALDVIRQDIDNAN